MRTSPPAALTERRSRSLPGTRSMSPNEQKMTSGREAIRIALSICSIGVTHTGQPGPCTSVISGGSKSSMPNLTMECVCPPHHFHEGPGPGGDVSNRSGVLLREPGVAVFVYVFHRVPFIKIGSQHQRSTAKGFQGISVPRLRGSINLAPKLAGTYLTGR